MTKPYLESIAKGYTSDFDSLGELNKSLYPGGDCGFWSSFVECDCGRWFARTLDCGREWCSQCQERIENRRLARWLPKARQVEVMGYLVVTFPPEGRPRKKEELRRVRRGIVRGLKRLGFNRGLSRWHWFGEQGRDWHPHLNLLLDCGKISKQRLQKIKEMISRVTGCDRHVVHYSYSRVRRRKVHTLRYVLRNTFLNKEWDGEMARELWRFNNAHSWGSWKDDPVWDLDEDPESGADEDVDEFVICSDCGRTLSEHKGKWSLIPSSLLPGLGFKEIRPGWFSSDRGKTGPPGEGGSPG